MLIENAPTHRRDEAELLLSCARATMDDERAKRIKTLAGKATDWDYLLDIALQHGVVPLLYRNLSLICPQAVPLVNLNQLKSRFHSNATRNFSLLAELLRLIELAGKNGIRVVPFKGPVLAIKVYGNLAFREFGDLDILVHKADLNKTEELLISAGYRRRRERAGPRDLRVTESDHAYTFVRDDGKVQVDLHWKVAQSYYSFPIEPESLWAHLEPVLLGGREVLTFPPEESLLILSVHGFKHFWDRLTWICDIAEIVTAHQDIDWPRVLERAERLDSQRVLFLALLLAKNLLGAAVPANVLEKSKADKNLESLVQRVSERLFTKEKGLHDELDRTLFTLRMRRRLRPRLRYLLHQVRIALTPNEKDRHFLPLPRSFFVFYYLFRPTRLTTIFLWSSCKRMFNRRNVTKGIS